MYANCSVRYSGRAEATLAAGNYLILWKKDGTLLIHGGRLAKPLNYQPPGGELFTLPDRLICKRGKERVEILLHKVHMQYKLLDWSEKKIQIHKTEDELKKKFIRQADRHIPGQIITIKEEAPTPLGKVDVLITTYDMHHVVEVKRGKANISACSQLLRYVDHFRNQGIKCRGYLVCPAISKTVPDYLAKNDLRYIRLDF